MIRIARMAGQIGVLAILFGAATTLADWPRYSQIPEQSAMVKLSFTHGASRKTECRRRTAEELAKLPPNMRKPMECPRSRQAIYVELDLDKRTIYRAWLPPSGFSGDEPSHVYQRFVLSAGSHDIAVRMRDTPRTEGFDYSKSATIALSPDQNFVVDFRPDADGFVFR